MSIKIGHYKKILLWCTGIIVLISSTSLVMSITKEYAQMNYNPTLFFWTRFLLYSLIGIGVALVPYKLRISNNRNLSLIVLIVALICIGIAIIQPWISTFNFFAVNNQLLIPLIQLSNQGWISILGGFLLTTSIKIFFKIKFNTHS